MSNRPVIVIFDPETVGHGDVYARFDLPGDEGRLYADALGIAVVMANGTTIVSATLCDRTTEKRAIARMLTFCGTPHPCRPTHHADSLKA
jgi:hypothetical protein